MNSLAQAIRRLHHMAASSLMSLSSRRSNAPEEITLGALEEAEASLGGYRLLCWMQCRA